MISTARLWLVSLSLILAGCAVSNGVRAGREPRVTYLSPVTEIDLVGTDSYRRHGCYNEEMTREELQRYLHELFIKHDNRLDGKRYSIGVYDGLDLGPDLGKFGAAEAKQMAPIVTIARKYGCDVYVIHPDRFGLDAVGCYYQLFPPASKKRPK